MWQSVATTFWLGLVTVDQSALAVFLSTNVTCTKSRVTTYGKDKCPCVGIDNLKGYYATQQQFYHVQYAAEAGASCAAWDDGMHPKCRGGGPTWCKQKWCYVDPCNCDLDVVPKVTKAGIEYQGGPAYWSYDTCGGVDFWSQDMDPDACTKQKSEAACSKNENCAWNGKQCGGKEAVNACSAAKKNDVTKYGEEDCRCVGLGGRSPGKAFMYVNKKDLAEYPANLGATCEAWEMDAHPDCLKDGSKPAWCSAKWCFVDPCKCKAAVPPKAVMKSNSDMRFQGKTAYWSYATCGSTDSWSSNSSHGGVYCNQQKSEAACSKVSKCAWDGKQCLGKALVEICAKQEESGLLGMEAPLPGSGARGLGPLAALLWALGALAALQLR